MCKITGYPNINYIIIHIIIYNELRIIDILNYRIYIYISKIFI